MILGIIEARLYVSQSLDFVQDMFPLLAEILLTSKGTSMLYWATIYLYQAEH